MSELTPRDLIKLKTRERNNKNFWLRSSVKARNELTQGPRDLRPPRSQGVTFYSPKYEPDTRSTRPMTRADYASGTTLNEKGQVTSQVPRVSKGVQRAGALDLFPKLKGAVEQASRPLKIANPIWRAASALDNLAMFLPTPDQQANNGYNRYPAEGGYWEKRYGDFGPYSGYNPLNGLWMHTNTWHTTLSGQALSGTVNTSNSFTAPADGTYGLYWRRYDPVTRYAHHSSYFKQTDAFNPAITSHKWADATGINANFSVGPSSASAMRNKTGEKVKNLIEQRAELYSAYDQMADTDPLSMWKAVAVYQPFIDPLSVSDTKNRTDPQTKPVLQPLTPAGKKPAGKNEKHGKPNPRKWAVAAYKAMDNISEAAEVVDALYDALPDDVQKRWEKDRESRGLADQAGQYGIDGADWKAQAIWHNAHKIDWDEAIKNIIQNQVEDALYGAAYSAQDDLRGRGKNRGNPKRQFDKNRKYNHKRSSEKRAAKWSR